MAEGIDLVRPGLHHLGALGQALVSVVDRGNRCIDMLKLEVNRLLGEARQVYAIDRDPLCIQQGRAARCSAGPIIGPTLQLLASPSVAAISLWATTPTLVLPTRLTGPRPR
jgi:hypothetical protein